MKPFQPIYRELVDELSSMVANKQIQNQCRLLGEGLSGRVYEYENFAVKVFKEDGSENDDYRMLNRLHHHSAFPTLHYYEDRFMLMDKCDGTTLARERESGDGLKDAYFTQIEQVVEECYQVGIIPRDLHLNNVMVDRDNRIKIVDVGRFVHTDQSEDYKERLTEDLQDLKYHVFGFGFFSSSRRKRRRHRYRSSGSRSHSNSHSSRSYSSSRRKRRKYRRKRYHSS
ncbi:protein kinase domain-containing protein [Desmospora activa]|uniref:Protein kinase-like protein n=1 Tax=Desmospora activa DSM 45169 TaxID=1121389 RepID=A0A2T4Z4V8_9BACL|nr:protein kinase family protein [Desmospora activa]PTM56929.1 protein kinase-like protein [Desmospora activa DSM 45169]